MGCISGGFTLVKGGDTYIETTLLNQEEVDSSHPLKEDGFLTAGYSIEFVARRQDSNSPEFTLSGTASSETIAQFPVTGSDTEGVAIAHRSGLRLHYFVRVSGVGGVFITERGEFLLVEP